MTLLRGFANAEELHDRANTKGKGVVRHPTLFPVVQYPGYKPTRHGRKGLQERGACPFSCVSSGG